MSPLYLGKSKKSSFNSIIHTYIHTYQQHAGYEPGSGVVDRAGILTGLRPLDLSGWPSDYSRRPESLLLRAPLAA